MILEYITPDELETSAFSSFIKENYHYIIDLKIPQNIQEYTKGELNELKDKPNVNHHIDYANSIIKLLESNSGTPGVLKFLEKLDNFLCGIIEEIGFSGLSIFVDDSDVFEGGQMNPDFYIEECPLNVTEQLLKSNSVFGKNDDNSEKEKYAIVQEFARFSTLEIPKFRELILFGAFESYISWDYSFYAPWFGRIYNFRSEGSLWFTWEDFVSNIEIY